MVELHFISRTQFLPAIVLIFHLPIPRSTCGYNLPSAKNALILCLLPNLAHNPSLSVPTLPSHDQLLLESVSFASEKVEKFLATLNSDSATGLDGISSRVRKTRSAALCTSSVIFTRSFALSHLPFAWKSANIITLHKKWCINQSPNYRPISLLPIIIKVTESIIAVDKKSFLFSNNLISDHQFGFRPCHLLSKLSANGIQGQLHTWLTDFLHSRSHHVALNGILSPPLPVARLEYSVQGSVLGPVLFLIFINDLSDSLANPLYLFADDSTLCSDIPHPSDR